MKILIGYDGSESSDAALDDLKMAGLPRDSEVLILSVADLFKGGLPIVDPAEQVFTSGRAAAALQRLQTNGEQVIQAAHALASKSAERLRTEFPEWQVNFEVVTGSPAWEVIDAADNRGADLVIVGSQGRTAIGRLFLGSVSKKVVTDAHSSVRVARRSDVVDDNAPPKIIIGVDGSPAAEQAIYSVGQRVWPEGTEVRMVFVDDITPPTRIAGRLPQAAEMINSYLQKKDERVRAMLEWANGELSAIGLKTSVEAVKGEPKDILLAQARGWNADCIFVGTRDFKSGFERFRLGSVSTAIVTNAHCSVEVVRPPVEKHE